jgi:hypothetical protein
MDNLNNKVVVQYPNGALRVRNCKTTVMPTKSELGPITDYNHWQIHLAIVTDARYNAFNRIDTIVSTENLLCDAKMILNKHSI